MAAAARVTTLYQQVGAAQRLAWDVGRTHPILLSMVGQFPCAALRTLAEIAVSQKWVIAAYLVARPKGKSVAPGALSAYGPAVIHTYPPLNLKVRTPRLTLAGASDELLEQLVPIVRAGVADTAPWPFDDPMSLYADSPDREWRWLRSIWRGRARVDESFWRLYFVVLLDGEPIGMQDLKGSDFTKFGTVSTFSWLAPAQRGRGIGKEMRAAILHLAFAGLGAREAESDAFTDNNASNNVSRALGYEPNGTTWDTRRGEAAPIQRWLLTREAWDRVRRDDIELVGIQECLPALGLA